ncbi:hypothetical protein Vau01_096410 [Virgisporangium aurantiacum]|uniref:SsuA/THI5-like domain-containing protein n=1 Tax=Virgisporangium aurantiacum TaxID=175570 RepID=A0A8J4E4N6_9ACTN|nr:hypothetical protein Vau01_096410 [Virgisporangium aurantiacum]
MLSPKSVAPLLARRGLLTAAAGGAAATLIGCSNNKPRRPTSGKIEKVAYLTGFNITGQDAFLYVAKEQGYFHDAGLDVDIQAGAGTQRNLATLKSGKAQIACIDVAGGIIESQRKPAVDFRIFATIYQRGVSCIVALPTANIHAPQDLKGKKIGFTVGGVNRSIFPAYASAAGMKDSDIAWVEMAPTGIRPALMAGQLDASTEIVIGRPAIEAAARAAGKLRPGETVTMLPYSDLLRDVVGNAIGCLTETAMTNPDLVRGFRDATMRGLVDTIADPAQAGEIMAKHVPAYTPEIAAAEVKEMIPYVRGSDAIGYLDPVRVRACIALIQGLGLVPSGVAPENIVAFDLQPHR